MGKRRKPAGPKLADDPHGWLVGVLQGELAHSVKAQRAVTALTGFESIAGSEQGAGSNRPFDHQASDDSIRLDTKTQKAGLLDVKQEKPGKQFTAWFAAAKRFLPVQLVLDGLTNSWYVVPGIPRKTLALDPLVTAFDPAEPLAPFKIAEGCLEDLLDKAEFLVVQERILTAFSCLLAAKESLMKVIDAEYRLYMQSTAEDMADNPELMDAVTQNARALDVFAANPNAARAVARNADALEVIASDKNAVRTIARSADAREVIASDKDTVRAIAKKPDAVDAIASDQDTVRAIAKSADAIEAIATDRDAMRALTANENARRAFAADEEAMRDVLGPELFEAWQKSRQS